jgi:hypothetical protein
MERERFADIWAVEQDTLGRECSVVDEKTVQRQLKTAPGVN